MTSPTDLVSSVQAALQGLVASGIGAGTPMHDLYEVYIFGLVVRAANAEKASISFEDCNGQPTMNAVFPSGPRYITTKTAPYTHAVLDFGGANEPLEAHVGLYVEGSSGCYHELDVVVIDRFVAQSLRGATQLTLVPTSSVRLLCECKFYTSQMGLGLIRAYWGLQAEFGGRPSFFALSTSSTSARKYLIGRKSGRDYQPDIVPNAPADEARLLGLFQEIFKTYRMS
jgi:hypothetical protein